MRKLIYRDIVEGLLVVLVSVGIGLLSVARLPSKVPIHFDVSWRPDGYATKPLALSLLMGMPIFIWVLITACYWLAITESGSLRLDETSARWVRLIRLFVALFMISVEASIVAVALGWLDSPRVVLIPMLGLLFIVIGEALPHLRPNWVAGIRLPWTIVNESVWRRTHFVGGRSFMVLGSMALFLPFMPTWMDVVWFAILLTFIVAIVCYAYFLYRVCK